MARLLSGTLFLAALLAAPFALGCGARSYDDGAAESTTSGSYSSGYDAVGYGAEADDAEVYEEQRAPAARTDVASAGSTARPAYAQATPRRRRAPPTPPAASATREPQESAQTATDAVDTSGPLLIYTAVFHLAVYEVVQSQERIVAAARELGGFVFTRADDRLVLRVPAPRFHALLEQVERSGDVEHREVQAQDVSEEFHDVEIRIRNLEAMRARVEALLAQAQTVEDALRVEQQLQRLTEELERLRGRQRFLADRVAFSTVTVLFRPRPRELVGQPDVFELPFAWLDQLGLSTLLDLR